MAAGTAARQLKPALLLLPCLWKNSRFTSQVCVLLSAPHTFHQGDCCTSHDEHIRCPKLQSGIVKHVACSCPIHANNDLR